MKSDTGILLDKEHEGLAVALSPVIKNVMGFKALDVTVLGDEAEKLEDLIKAIKGMMNDNELPIVVDAKALIINSEENLESFKEKKKGYISTVKLINEAIERRKKPYKRLHTACCDLETLLTKPVNEAKSIAEKERNRYLDWLDEEAAKEEERLKKERLAAILIEEKRLKKLIDGKTDIQAGINEMQSIIDNPESSDIEAEAAQSQLTLLEGKLERKDNAILDKEHKVDEIQTASTMTYSSRTATRGIGGTRKEIVPLEVYNPMAVLKSIVDGKVPITVLEGGGKGMKAWSLSGMKLHLNNVGLIPGLRTTEKRV